MKRWALVVVALYGAMFVLLTLPVFLGSFWGSTSWGSNQELFSSSLEFFRTWQYWGILAALMLAQAAVLIIPVRVAQKRPVTRKTVVLPVVAAAILIAALFVALAYTVMEAVYEFESPGHIETVAWALAGIVWIFWAVVFYRWSRKSEPRTFIDKLCKTLLAGSILELLIAVPTHVIVRNKDYCCAGFYTFSGLAFGLAVTVFSFGPGIFFLFVARAKRLQPQQKG